jgi:hypothetical protein
MAINKRRHISRKKAKSIARARIKNTRRKFSQKGGNRDEYYDLPPEIKKFFKGILSEHRDNRDYEIFHNIYGFYFLLKVAITLHYYLHKTYHPLLLELNMAIFKDSFKKKELHLDHQNDFMKILLDQVKVELDLKYDYIDNTSFIINALFEGKFINALFEGKLDGIPPNGILETLEKKMWLLYYKLNKTANSAAYIYALFELLLLSGGGFYKQRSFGIIPELCYIMNPTFINEKNILDLNEFAKYYPYLYLIHVIYTKANPDPNNRNIPITYFHIDEYKKLEEALTSDSPNIYKIYVSLCKLLDYVKSPELLEFKIMLVARICTLLNIWVIEILRMTYYQQVVKYMVTTAMIKHLLNM